MLQMFVLALSLYNTWNRGVFLLCKITNLLIYSYIVNFDYVEGIQNDNVLIKCKSQQIKAIPVSKYKKEEFMRALARYVGNWTD